jgi:hypothetical protein
MRRIWRSRCHSRKRLISSCANRSVPWAEPMVRSEAPEVAALLQQENRRDPQLETFLALRSRPPEALGYSESVWWRCACRMKAESRTAICCGFDSYL